MFNLPNHFTGTYAKNAIADWSILFNGIVEKTVWVKDAIQDTDAKLPILSDQQMNDAFNGPFQAFFKSHLRTYAHISKIEMALTIKNDDFFKESEHTIDTTFGIPESLLTKTDFSMLKDLRKQCDEVTSEHYAQWQADIQNWTDTLLREFKKNNITLSDLEIQAFSINQPMSEIEDQFIHLKLALPDFKKTGCDFQQYFILTLTLIIQSALGRSQQPNTDKDIAQVIKSFQPTLKTINKAEKALSQTQEKALAELIAAIKF